MWSWPLKTCPRVPTGKEPGAFGAVRKHDIHTGVDLYCSEGEEALAVEAGVVEDVVYFTGPRAESPWWNETFAVLVHGPSGVVVYGEVQELVEEGATVSAGQPVGRVLRVLPRDKGLPTTMLHVELYAPAPRAAKPVWWKHGQPQPPGLLDPTPFLLQAAPWA